MKNELDKFSAGALFVRADLHIHSFGEEGSYDVVDSTMTPEAIVDLSVSKNLAIISITDHNEIGNVRRALKHAEGKNILVIPGIEVSTTQGHLLVYFEKLDELSSFKGRLSITADKKLCSQGIVECLDIAKQFNGIGILAHIELDSGFEKTIGRFGPHMEAAFLHPLLYGLEISSKNSIDYYTDNDKSSDRKQLISKRRETFQSSNFNFPKLMSSDSHKLDKLGVNADGETKLTRIKVNELTFQAFKVALISHSSRIRLENVIPNSVPKFNGIIIEGGLLDKQTIRFSNNLTCIIGGRGTGKSTLLESLREVSGNGTQCKMLDTEVWPEKISLLYEDEVGREFIFSREKNSSIINTLDPINGITKIEIESYGQGDTAETIQHGDGNPKVLVDFLDKFIDLNGLKLQDIEIRNHLLENQSQLNKLRLEVAAIPDTKKHKDNLEAKFEQLKKDKVGELVEYQSALLKERQLRESIIKSLNTLLTSYKSTFSDAVILHEFTSINVESIVVGKENFSKVKEIIESFEQTVKEKSAELSEHLSQKIEELKVQIGDWATKEKGIQDKIDAKKKELEEKGIPFDIGKINQITKDLLDAQKLLKNLEEKQKELLSCQDIRKELVKRRIEITKKIYSERFLFAKKINENLKESVDGLMVNVKYYEGQFSREFEQAIKNLMDWRTSQVPKSYFIANEVSPLAFAQAVKAKNLDILKNIKNGDGVRILSDSEIDSILVRTLQNVAYEDFEAMPFDDKPVIMVTKIVNDNGQSKPISRTLGTLSLGQQQSILLAILLQSKSTVPLIIDQPEDNLDSEFIFKTIVSNLRKIKENRQVIIVTHNPNIAILGDAELIIPLKSTNVKSIISERGSIDKKETSSICCEILEGGQHAFNSRKAIYGI